MLSNDRKQINLLHPVREDNRLLKHQKLVAALKNAGIDLCQQKERDEAFSNDIANPNMTGDKFAIVWQEKNVWDGVPFSVQRQFSSPFMRKAMEYYIKFRLLFNNPTKDPVELFAEVKSNFKELENADETELKKVLDLLSLLEKSKQVAAAKAIKAKQYLVKTENKLFQEGIVQYQTEESLIKFILKCKKGLCLTEIENFDRVIPTEVVDKINAAEELRIFDNYYILHYDPTGAKNIHLTSEPKDPIVFGVIRNSTRLYYIADWIDEYCNLTYKDILSEGKDFQLKLEQEFDL